MTKIIITFFVIGCLALYSPIKEDTSVPIPIHKSPVVAKIVHRTITNHVANKYVPPMGKPLEIALKISKETGKPLTTISKIMFYESHYDSNSVHHNKNHTYDSGLMQINSSHLEEAKKMGIDIFTDEGNAQFSIYLIKTYGLSPWSASKIHWNS